MRCSEPREGAIHALWDRNRGKSGPWCRFWVLPGSAEATELIRKPDYCKRLSLRQPDSDVSSGMRPQLEIILPPLAAQPPPGVIRPDS